MLEKFQQLKTKEDEEILLDVYHSFMKEYGYIPLKDFKEIPIPLILELLGRINKDYENLKRRMKK